MPGTGNYKNAETRQLAKGKTSTLCRRQNGKLMFR